MNKIIIQQSKQQTESINSGVLDKLYRYALQSKVEDPSYNLTMQLQGNVTPIAAYLDAVDYLTEKFPDLIINEPTKGYYVRFKDSVVESIIFNNLVNVIYPNKYDGVIVTLELNNSGNENQLGFKQNFKNNQDITSFDELSQLVNVKALANEEFRDCNNLESIDLTKIEYLGQNCFRSSYNLEYFNGKNSEIGTLNMPNLKYNGLSKGGAFYCWKDGDVYRGPRVKKILDLGDCTNIGGDTFMQNTQLEYVAPEVFEKLTKIGSNAFNMCENLVIEDLKLPNITEIGASAFLRTKVKTISELGVCTILNYAFQNCSQLTTISDEAFANITSLGNAVFENCTNLVVEDLKLPKLNLIGSNTFQYTKIKNVSNLGNCTVVQGFKNVSTLQHITLPASCNELGTSAFESCVNLEVPNLDNIKFFGYGCFAFIPSITGVKYFPQCTTFGYRVFNGTGVRSLYLPALLNTGGTKGTEIPQVWRNSTNLLLGHTSGAASYILYLKNINKIHGATFGGIFKGKKYSLDINELGTGTRQQEYQGEPLFKVPYTNADPYQGDNNCWADLKYLVINNITPPQYYNSYANWGQMYCGSLSLYTTNTNRTHETFHYLCVPRAAIPSYKEWVALNPQFNTGTNAERLTEEDRNELRDLCAFDVNTRIIAIESMPHFATKAEYDASDITNKDDYLIEEYMGLADGETINWDATPTQYS